MSAHTGGPTNLHVRVVSPYFAPQTGFSHAVKKKFFQTEKENGLMLDCTFTENIRVPHTTLNQLRNINVTHRNTQC